MNQTTVLVECSCPECRKYAATNGLPFPMRAMATPQAADRVPAPNLVHSAYDPVLAHAAIRPAIPA
jgi:hypothetical protein